MKKILKFYLINALAVLVLILINKAIVFLGVNILSISLISGIGYIIGYIMFGVSIIILESQEDKK